MKENYYINILYLYYIDFFLIIWVTKMTSENYNLEAKCRKLKFQLSKIASVNGFGLRRGCNILKQKKIITPILTGHIYLVS